MCPLNGISMHESQAGADVVPPTTTKSNVSAIPVSILSRCCHY